MSQETVLWSEVSRGTVALVQNEPGSRPLIQDEPGAIPLGSGYFQRVARMNEPASRVIPITIFQICSRSDITGTWMPTEAVM